jgi:hypothetical protein
MDVRRINWQNGEEPPEPIKPYLEKVSSPFPTLGRGSSFYMRL